MTHEDARELTELYVLGALPEAESETFVGHLRTCEDCQREVASFARVTIGLLQIVPDRMPPAGLRNRVLDAAISGRAASATHTAGTRAASAGRWSVVPWLAAAAALLIAAAAVMVAARSASRARSADLETRRATARAAAAEATAREAKRQLSEATRSLAVLTAPDVVRVELAGQRVAPSAAGRAFWSRSRGLVFTASHLPPVPPSRTYQLWVVTATSPISAGVLRTDASGDVSAMFNTPSDIPPPIAMAVTLEPAGGVATPTGDKYLVGVPPR